MDVYADRTPDSKNTHPMAFVVVWVHACVEQGLDSLCGGVYTLQWEEVRTDPCNQPTDRRVLFLCIWSRAGKSEAGYVGWLWLVK